MSKTIRCPNCGGKMNCRNYSNGEVTLAFVMHMSCFHCSITGPLGYGKTTLGAKRDAMARMRWWIEKIEDRIKKAWEKGYAEGRTYVEP